MLKNLKIMAFAIILVSSQFISAEDSSEGEMFNVYSPEEKASITPEMEAESAAKAKAESEAAATRDAKVSADQESQAEAASKTAAKNQQKETEDENSVDVGSGDDSSNNLIEGYNYDGYGDFYEGDLDVDGRQLDPNLDRARGLDHSTPARGVDGGGARR